MFEYRLEHVFSYYITAKFPEVVGHLPEGLRLNFYFSGGEMTGPKLFGKVRPVGGDWLIVRRDGIGILDVRATLETRDGALIYATLGGTIDFGEDGYERMSQGKPPPSGAPFRTSPRFESAHPSYLWLNRLHYIGIGATYIERSRMSYDVYAVR
jgi:hypothetical protein